MAENFFGITDTGKQRTNNEDTFIAQATANRRYIIAAVIDGVGGYEGGEIAAAIARDTMIKEINSSPFTDWPAALTAVFEKANENIIAEKQKNKGHEGMACVSTMAVADPQENVIRFAHVGDTRAYLFRDGSLIKLTSDHSFVGFLEDSGRITEDAAMKHPKRNEINKALGFEANIHEQQHYVETGSSPFLPGDILLLCSDGLTDMVNKQDIIDILSSGANLKDAGRSLIDMANHNGGIDNVTVVLVKNDKKRVAVSAIKPADQKKTIEPVAEPVVPVTPPKPEPVVIVPEPVKTEPVAKAEPVTEVEEKKPRKRGRSLTFFIALICLIAIIGYFLYQNGNGFGSHPANTAPAKDSGTTTTDSTSTTTTATTKTASTPSTKSPSADQVKVQQMLDGLKNDTLKLADSTFKNPIAISSTLQLKKDTLYIKTSGNVSFTADSSFAGPVFAFPQTAKVIVINHVGFSGFKTAISAYNNALVLKGVTFTNCQVPVQVSITSASGTPVTGWLPSDILKADSAKKAVASKPAAKRSSKHK